MSGETLIVIVLIVPAATALLIPLFAHRANPRETVTLLGAVMLFAAALALLSQVLDGARPAVHVLDILPGLSIAFAVEPLGMLFATVASGLWIVNSLYSIGYMRANGELRQTTFYVCFAGAITATMGVALAGNLFTLFMFYELLTLVTYPLVAHRRTAEAKSAGRLYLIMLLGASTVLLLPAIAWVGVVAGTLDFRSGGILAGVMGPVPLGILLALFVFGIGKAAVMPMHFWLPAAMVAPTPVSALLHAVAVVKAGVFFIVKVIVYIFGIDTLKTTGAGDWLVYVAGTTVLVASVIALGQDNLKRRLAYSTISQLSYVVMGAALATTSGVIGGSMQIAMHAAGKITLFFCAGAIHVATHKSRISEMAGIGRAMPVTMTAFLVGSLSIIGLPPMGGTWSKWWLLVAAAEDGHLFVIAVLFLSTLLNVAYLLPIVARAFFAVPSDRQGGSAPGFAEAPLACVAPLAVTALLCVALFLAVDTIEELLGGMFAATK